MRAMRRSRLVLAWMNRDPEKRDRDSPWLSQICEHTGYLYRHHWDVENSTLTAIMIMAVRLILNV